MPSFLVLEIYLLLLFFLLLPSNGVEVRWNRFLNGGANEDETDNFSVKQLHRHDDMETFLSGR
jgi:hypothetical protein